MPTIIFVRKTGQELRVAAEPGQSIMEAATGNMVPGILGDCGGCVCCGTCEATIGDPWRAKLPAQREDEIALLEDTLSRSPNTRLTCQIQVTDALDGIVVHLP